MVKVWLQTTNCRVLQCQTKGVGSSEWKASSRMPLVHCEHICIPACERRWLHISRGIKYLRSSCHMGGGKKLSFSSCHKIKAVISFTLSKYFIRYIFLIPGRTAPFSIRTVLIDLLSLWKDFLGDFRAYWQNIIRLLQICQLHIKFALLGWDLGTVEAVSS